MTLITDLESIRSDAVTRLTAILASPKPSYSVDGQAFSWNEYHDMLMRTIESTTKLIDEQQALANPFEVVTRGIT